MFFGAFLLALGGFSFWRGDGHWAIILWGLDTFLIFPNFVSLELFGNSSGNSYMPCL